MSLHRHSHRPPGQCRRVGTARRDAGTRRKPNKRRNSTLETQRPILLESVYRNFWKLNEAIDKTHVTEFPRSDLLTTDGATWSQVMSLDNSMFHKTLTSQLVQFVQFEFVMPEFKKKKKTSCVTSSFLLLFLAAPLHLPRSLTFTHFLPTALFFFGVFFKVCLTLERPTPPPSASPPPSPP